MATLESKFSRADIDTLIGSVDEWETSGNQEYHLLNMVKSAPMPPEDHEAFEMMSHIKEHFLKREREIKESRETRQEKATLLKAKLMLVRTDMGIEQLFEMATEPIGTPVEVKKEAPAKPKPTSENVEGMMKKVGLPSADEIKAALDKAEYFIKDMGVWSYYEKFLAEKSSE